ncbi:MAG: hypothetical protein ACQESC_04060, partial [Nanobdellota archaeon]
MTSILLKLFIAFSLLSILIVPVTAVDITDVSFKAGGYEITAISPRKQLQTSISFKINTNESLSRVVGNFSALTSNPKFTYDYGETDLTDRCFEVYEDNGAVIDYYNCTTETMIMSLQDSSLTLPITIYPVDGGKNTTNISKTFDIDDTKPVLEALETSYCDGETCYVGSYMPAKVGVSLSDSKATYNLKNIFFKIGSGYKRQVSNCTGSFCYGYTVMRGCESGQSLSLSIVSSNGMASSDDARNPIVGDLSRSVVCDELEPGNKTIFTNDDGTAVGRLFTLSYPDSQTYPYPVEGQDLTVSVAVSEDQTPVSGTLNLSTLDGSNATVPGDCVELDSGDGYNCSWVVRSIRPGEHSLNFTINDSVGHKIIFSEDVHVDESSTAKDRVTPDFFADVTGQTPVGSKGYNRVALGLAQDAQPSFKFPMFAEYDRELLSGYSAYDIQPLSSSIVDCVFEYPNGTLVSNNAFDYSIRNSLPQNTETDRNVVDLYFDGNPNRLPDELVARCNISVHVRDGTKRLTYINPDHFTVTIPLHFTNSALGDFAPGEHYAEKIKDLQDKIAWHGKVVQKIALVHNWLTSICKAGKLVDNAKSKNDALGGVGSLLKQLGESGVPAAKPIGEIITKTSDTIRDVLTKISDYSGSTFVNNVTDAACMGAYCSLEESTDEYSGSGSSVKSQKVGDSDVKFWSFGGTPFNYGFDNAGEYSLWGNEGDNSDDGDFASGTLNDLGSEVFDGVGVPHPKDSIISSIATGCIPGVAYHYTQYVNMLCEKLICMKTQASIGGSISSCERMQGRYICKNLFDEFFEVFGPAKVVSDVMDNANEIIQNFAPKMLNILVNNFYCNSADAKKLDGPGAMDLVKVIVCRIPDSYGQLVRKNTITDTQTEEFDFNKAAGTCEYATCNIQESPDDCYASFTKYSDSRGGGKAMKNIADYINFDSAGFDIASAFGGGTCTSLPKEARSSCNEFVNV